MQPEEVAVTPFPTQRQTGEWFETLFREQYPRLVGLLTRLTGDRAQAEEIAADTFSKLAGRSLLANRVAFNAGMDAVRANARRRKNEEAALRERLREGESPGALDLLLREQRTAQVRAILTELKTREAQILLLRSSGLAYREIAQALGVAPSSVGTILARAEREFEKKYRARFGDDV